MRVIVLSADDRVLSPVCQLTVLDDNLCPLSLAHEDVAPARCDIAAILQPANVHVLGAHLALQADLASLLHVDILQVADKLDGNPWIKNKKKRPRVK